MKEKLKALNNIALAIMDAEDLGTMSDQVMELLPDLIQHNKSFFTYSAIGSRKRKSQIRSLTISPALQHEYIERFEASDYTSWYLNQRHVKVYRDSDIITPDVMTDTDIYREWINPMGMHYLCGNVIRNNENRYAELTLLRSKDRGDFTDEELYLLSLVTDLMLKWCEKRFGSAYKAVNDVSVSDYNMRVKQSALTEREHDVAQLICNGLNTREISEHLSISYGTTRKHIANIYSKLGISNRVALIKRFKEDGLSN